MRSGITSTALIFKKLREEQPFTPQDITELEKMLVSLTESQSDKLLKKLLKRNQTTSLPHFICSCVGIDRKAVKGRFTHFLFERSLNPGQISFIELIIDQLTETGILSPRALYE